jgi:hypothetical protein
LCDSASSCTTAAAGPALTLVRLFRLLGELGFAEAGCETSVCCSDRGGWLSKPCHCNSCCGGWLLLLLSPNRGEVGVCPQSLYMWSVARHRAGKTEQSRWWRHDSGGIQRVNASLSVPCCGAAKACNRSLQIYPITTQGCMCSGLNQNLWP